MRSKMKTYEEVYQFIKENYKHERFEDRDTPTWNYAGRYPDIIVKRYMADLEKTGIAYISKHESIRGEFQVFNSELQFVKLELELSKELPQFIEMVARPGYEEEQLEKIKKLIRQGRIDVLEV